MPCSTREMIKTLTPETPRLSPIHAERAQSPDAAVKIWLTASLRERARRRALELGGEDVTSVTNTEADLEARDAADSRRPVSPLAKAADAVTIDSTGKPVEEVVAEVVRVVRQKLHDHH